MLAQVYAADAGQVDLVEDGVVRFGHVHVVVRVDLNLNTCLRCKLTVVLCLHDQVRLDGQHPVGQAVQCPEEREVSLGVQLRELDQGPVARFGGRFLGERKVANA